MQDLLIHSARELTDDEAGGHGDHWSVFDQDLESLIDKWLVVAIESSRVPKLGFCGKAELEQIVARGEPEAVALLYAAPESDIHMTGLMSLFVPDEGGPNQKPSNQLQSAFPFFGEGQEVEAQVEQIFLFHNRVEARLELSLTTGATIYVFDSSFWVNRAGYHKDRFYRFIVSALAYEMGHAPALQHVISDETQIRRFRARDAWAKTHGYWTREDEEASLAAWQPESPDDLEPIRISMDEMAMLLPIGSGPSDDAQFRGEVVRVIPDATHLMDVTFWRIDTVVMRDSEDLVLPIYVAEHLFEGEWRPHVGEYVYGTLWMQAHATNLVVGK